MKVKLQFIVFLIIAVFFLYRFYRVYFYSPEIDFQKLKLQSLNGNSQSLSSQDLNATIIVFFQTWCAPCIAEMSLVQKHFTEFKFVKIYFVTDEESNKVIHLKQRLKLDSLNFLISDEKLPNIGIEAFPTAYILKNGKIVESHKGAFIDESNFEDELYHLKELTK